MVPVRGRMVAGERKRHVYAPVLLVKLSCFHRWKVVRLVLVAVDGKMRKADPRYAGYGVRVRRRRGLGLAEYAVRAAKPRLIAQIGLIKIQKACLVRRPHEGKRMVILVERRVQGR